ncbi:MAG: hypothetical protein WCR02_07255 [Sphaerochaetaceae bacterium]
MGKTRSLREQENGAHLPILTVMTRFMEQTHLKLQDSTFRQRNGHRPLPLPSGDLNKGTDSPFVSSLFS